MQITYAQVGNALYPLIEGQPLPITVGQIIRVFFSFKYRMPEGEDVAIWASLYQYTAGILNRAGAAQTKATITLDQSVEWKDYQGYIDIAVGSVSAGTYGLIVELPGRKEAEAKIDDCIEVAGGGFDLMSVMGLMVVTMMMGMIMPMMEEAA